MLPCLRIKMGSSFLYKQTDLIELYDIYGNLKKRIQGPDLFFPVIKQTIQDESVHVNSVSGQSRDAYFFTFIHKWESICFILWDLF